MVVSTATRQVVRLGPHLDVRNVGSARTALDDAVVSATGDVVVDMGAVESIDAAGLGMLTAMHLRCERSGLRLVLSNCPREIRRVLAVTRMNRILHLDRPQVTAAPALLPG
jgi:anti-anti-sigma factor